MADSLGISAWLSDQCANHDAVKAAMLVSSTILDLAERQERMAKLPVPDDDDDDDDEDDGCAFQQLKD